MKLVGEDGYAYSPPVQKEPRIVWSPPVQKIPKVVWLDSPENQTECAIVEKRVQPKKKVN